MLNNYFGNEKSSWIESVYILEVLGSNSSADAMLIELYEDLVQFPLKT
jgi:hypothetical protein